MRIAIYGAGALGGYYGALLQRAGHDVVYIARGKHLAAIQSNGLHVRSVEGDFHIESPTATDGPESCGVVDLVIIAVKTWQIPEITDRLGCLLGPDTMVLPMLNGVESADQIGAAIGRERMLCGISRVFCRMVEPGIIEHFKSGNHVIIGELDGVLTQRTERLAQSFSKSGIEVEVSKNIRTDLWKKLLMVTSWSGIGAIIRHPIGVVREQLETRTLVDQSMDEGIEVGRANGCDVSGVFKQELWNIYDNVPFSATSSMYRDILAGRPSELQSWNGAIVRFGKKAKVPTPIHEFVVHLLSIGERKSRNELRVEE